jgi:hypothetical protein
MEVTQNLVLHFMLSKHDLLSSEEEKVVCFIRWRKTFESHGDLNTV